MKRFPLLSLSLVAALGVGCSSPSQDSAPPPTPEGLVKKRTQALEGVSLVEIPVSPEVFAAAGAEARVRAFQIEGAAEGVSVAEVTQLAFQATASEPESKPWEAGAERDQEETRLTLRFLEGLMPAIETQVGTGEGFRSGYRHWWQTSALDYCDHGDFHSVVFETSRKVFIIEATGGAEC